jgi:hypothetical protein
VSSNHTTDLSPGRVRERLGALEEDVGDNEDALGTLRSDIHTIKYVLFAIAGMRAGDLTGLLELIKTLL